jgi:hypothetical protein
MRLAIDQQRADRRVAQRPAATVGLGSLTLALASWDRG